MVGRTLAHYESTTSPIEPGSWTFGASRLRPMECQSTIRGP